MGYHCGKHPYLSHFERPTSKSIPVALRPRRLGVPEDTNVNKYNGRAFFFVLVDSNGPAVAYMYGLVWQMTLNRTPSHQCTDPDLSYPSSLTRTPSDRPGISIRQLCHSTGRKTNDYPTERPQDSQSHDQCCPGCWDGRASSIFRAGAVSLAGLWRSRNVKG